jgi:hypothetical protein
MGLLLCCHSLLFIISPCVFNFPASSVVHVFLVFSPNLFYPFRLLPFHCLYTLTLKGIKLVSLKHDLRIVHWTRLRSIPSYGMWRRAALVRTYSSKLQMLSVTANVVASSIILLILMIEAIRSSKTSVHDSHMASHSINRHSS